MSSFIIRNMLIYNEGELNLCYKINLIQIERIKISSVIEIDMKGKI